MSFKQYVKSKPIKCCFRWWYRCYSKVGYLYNFDLDLGTKEKAEFWLGETFVFDLSKKLENTHCMLYFGYLASILFIEVRNALMKV